jgi:hypothetical protein
MKTLPLLFAVLLLAGCANPVMTGKPQHWMHKPAEDLKAVWGQPTRTIPQKDGTEVWEYVKSGDFVAPGEDDTTFGMRGSGGGGGFRASGGAHTTKRGEHPSRYENVWRFMIKNGKVCQWYASRTEDGRIVWEDH